MCAGPSYLRRVEPRTLPELAGSLSNPIEYPCEHGKFMSCLPCINAPHPERLRNGRHPVVPEDAR